MKIRIYAFILGIFVCTSGHSVLGQGQTYRLQSDKFGEVGCSYETWKADKDKVTELSLPVKFIYPYNDKLRFYAMTSPAFCSMDAGTDYSLSGLSDIKWGGHYLILDDRYLVTFGMNLPTGKSTLEVDEVPVANTLVLPAFRFRLPSLGQGFDIQLGLNTAREWGEYIVGAGITYLMKGGFKPFTDSDDKYNPGDELCFTVGADRIVNLFQREVRMTGDILYTLYFDDTWGGDKIFHSGNRWIFQLMSTFEMGSLDMVLFFREALKGNNKLGSEDVFETERKNSNANQFEIHSYGYYPYSQNVRLKGILELRLYSNNDFDRGGATLFGFGGGGQLRLTPRIMLDGDMRYYFGSLQSSTERVGTSGFKLFGSIQYTL